MARVRQDQDFSGPVRWRIIELNVSGQRPTDDIYVSFSSGREHGPIIDRVGNGSPRMPAVDENAIGDSYTTDPQLQRLGCWFISSEHKTKNLCSALLYLGLYWKKIEPKERENFRKTWLPSSGKVADKLSNLSSSIDNFWDSFELLDVKVKGEDIEACEKRTFIDQAGRILELITGSKPTRAPTRKEACTRLIPSEQPFIGDLDRLTETELTRRVAKWLTILLWSADSKVHTEELLLPCGHYQGYQGCGDLSMNFWNVGLIKVEGKDGDEPEHFIYPFDEPVEQRTYTCLVKWKELPAEANVKDRIEIRGLKFNRYAGAGDPGRALLIMPGQSPKAIANKLEFAIYGQQVIRNGELVDLRSTIMQYSDLRHTFLLPNLNPSDELPTAFDDNGNPIRMDEKRPRTLFSREQSDDVWLGEFALLGDRNRRMAALSGPVSFELSELGATQELIEGALYAQGPEPKPEYEKEKGKYYEWEKNPLTLLKPGQWRKTKEGREVWYEIYFRRNEYPCSMVGVTEDGRLLLLACSFPYSSREGWTIEHAAEHLASRGVKNALLIDEGGDVYQHLRDERDQIQVGREPREQVRCILIFGLSAVETN